LTKGLNLPPLPEKFDFQNIGTFLLSFMGLSWDNLQSILIKHLGPQNIALIDAAFGFIDNLIAQGPTGVYQLLQEKLIDFDPQTLVNTALDAGKNYLLTNVVPPTVAKIVGLFSPIPASLLLSIYDGLNWFFDQATTLVSVADTVVTGIGDVAAGNPTRLATAVENALKGLIVPVIDFGAKQLHLEGLPQTIGDLVKKPREAVEAQVEKWAGKLLGQALDKLGLAKQDAVGLVIEEEPPWEVDGIRHRERVITDGTTATVELATDWVKAPKRLDEFEQRVQNNAEAKAKITQPLAEARQTMAEVLALADRLTAVTKDVKLANRAALLTRLKKDLRAKNRQFNALVKGIQATLSAYNLTHPSNRVGAGNAGEQQGRAYLENKGYTWVGALKNNSNQGIDGVFTRGGKLFIVDMKASSARNFQLEPLQKQGPLGYAKDQIIRAINDGPPPQWKSQPSGTKDFAKKLKALLDTYKGKVEGLIVKIAFFGTPKQQIIVDDWHPSI
jgi:hypothetical protein